MAGHIAHLQREFANKGIDRQVLWMTSSGGLVPSLRAAELPVRLIESGPAAGAVAAAEFGRTAGEASVLSFDMGGTTAKLCLIPNGEPTVGTDLEVAHYQRFRKGSGFPLKIQSIQMIEIGAGGGSIAAKEIRLVFSMSVRARPAPSRDRPPTSAAARSRRSPMPTSCSAIWASNPLSEARSRSRRMRPKGRWKSSQPRWTSALTAAPGASTTSSMSP
jgi:hypothetical protein